MAQRRQFDAGFVSGIPEVLAAANGNHALAAIRREQSNVVDVRRWRLSHAYGPVPVARFPFPKTHKRETGNGKQETSL